jgi:hypothetical protein
LDESLSTDQTPNACYQSFRVARGFTILPIANSLQTQARQAGYAQEAIKNPPLLTGLVSVFSEDGLETEALYSTAAAASTPGHMAAN